MLGTLRLTNEKFIKQLRQRGALIGDHTVFFSPKNTSFDMNKAFLIKIGERCKITSGVTILAHDYSRSVARIKYGENIGGSAPVVIGNNCFIGVNAIIMMGTSIGDNCIVGAGAVVKGSFPSDCVIAGNPARVVCTLSDYTQKRKDAVLREAVMCVKHIFKTTGQMPTVKQMGDGFAWLYLPRTNATLAEYPSFFRLASDDPDSIVDDFMKTKPLFESFNAFLDFARKEIAQGNTTGI